MLENGPFVPQANRQTQPPSVASKSPEPGQLGVSDDILHDAFELDGDDPLPKEGDFWIEHD